MVSRLIVLISLITIASCSTTTQNTTEIKERDVIAVEKNQIGQNFKLKSNSRF